MATTNYKNTNFVSISTLTTVPSPTTQTGTISVTANTIGVVGVGTTFTTLREGMYIIDYVNFEIRKIMRIESDLLLVVDQPFSNTISGYQLYTCPRSRLVSVGLNVVGGVGKIDNVDFPTGTTILFDKSSRERQHSPVDYVDPIFIDGRDGSVSVWYQY